MNLQHPLVGSRQVAGYSYIQLLLVIALLAILAAVASPYYLQWQQRQRIQSTALMLLSDLRLAQTRAQQRANDAPWGIRIDDASKTYVIFHGANYNPTDQYNFTVSYSSSINLSPNQTIVFAAVSGQLVTPDASTITVSAASLPNETELIVISPQGVIERQ